MKLNYELEGKPIEQIEEPTMKASYKASIQQKLQNALLAQNQMNGAVPSAGLQVTSEGFGRSV